MKITIEDRGEALLERLRERLDAVSSLLCVEHGEGIVAVTIHRRENGWFDAHWTTCCEDLETRASAVVRRRC